MGLNTNVLNNTLDFMRRVEMKGLEAFAFVEAYTALQNEFQMAQNPMLAEALRNSQKQTDELKKAPPAPAVPAEKAP